MRLSINKWPTKFLFRFAYAQFSLNHLPRESFHHSYQTLVKLSLISFYFILIQTHRHTKLIDGGNYFINLHSNSLIVLTIKQNLFNLYQHPFFQESLTNFIIIVLINL